MKKYLIILPTIIGMTTGAIANNNQAKLSNITTTKSDINTEVTYSTDFLKYDISDGETKNFQLSNLFKLIKNLNQMHKEKQQEIDFVRVPRWNFINDNGEVFAVGFIFEPSLASLINSDTIKFKDVILGLSENDKIITLSINFELKGINKSIQLIQTKAERLPLQQKNMEASFEFIYQWL